MNKTFRAGRTRTQETLRLVDNEQEWIEKYRAALVQPTPGARSRLAAAWNTMARALGSAIGKTSGKLVGNGAQRPVHANLLPATEVQGDSRVRGPREQSADKLRVARSLSPNRSIHQRSTM